jgi:phosphoribosylanthranilate isomerase
MKSVSPSPRPPVSPSSAPAPAVQVKICGITTPADARLCVEAGANALGLVFHPQSSRFVRMEQALAIARTVPEGLPLVGVFADAAEAGIRSMTDRLGLSAVQLHGRESPALVAILRRAGLRVIKALFSARSPGLAEAGGYRADAFLVEAGAGPLPGGSGTAWSWDLPGAFSRGTPLILAGGLQAGNVTQVIRAARPDAVDVSSGVESAPGRKDPERVRAFLEAVRRCPADLTQTMHRRIF